MNARPLIKSIRVRLLLWLAFLLVALLTGFGVTAYQLHRTQQFESIDEELELRVTVLAREMRPRPGPGRFRPGPPPEWLPEGPLDATPNRGPDRGHDHPGRLTDGPGGRSSDRRSPKNPGPPRETIDGRFEGREIQLSTSTLRLFDDESTNGFYFALWSRSGSLLRISTNAPAGLGPPGPGEIDATVQTRTRNGFREALQLNSIGESIVAGRFIAADLAGLRRYALWLGTAGFAVLALGLGGAWGLTTRAIRPIEDIAGAARRISDGNLAERISVSDTDSEIGRLAGILNGTFARLEAAFAQQKQFTADASHELRTPISVILAETQATLARERSAAEYRETVETCLDAAQQMRRLTQSLLELARFDAGQEPLERVEFDVSERLRACVHLVEPLAAPRGIRFQLDLDLEAATAHGDPDRLCQVFINLLTNAVHYNRDGGHVRVTTRNEGARVVISVSDTGRGIDPGDIPHLFKRFYRGDKARRSANGQSGLGLAIAKAIVDAHQGTLEVASEPGSGTTFTVSLPANPGPTAPLSRP
ncbi:MAG: sensor histidine kinase [Limisphaerales bacterium]